MPTFKFNPSQFAQKINFSQLPFVFQVIVVVLYVFYVFICILFSKFDLILGGEKQNKERREREREEKKKTGIAERMTISWWILCIDREFLG